MRTVRLGDLLVQHGHLTPAQRDEILAAQETRRRPFGLLAEEMFGVNPRVVERAWAEQFASLAEHVDPRTFAPDREALAAIDRRQAWQFKVLPLTLERGAMLLCTTPEHLARAMRFAGWKVGHACQFVLAEGGALAEAMMRHYPMPGMGPRVIAAKA